MRKRQAKSGKMNREGEVSRRGIEQGTLEVVP